MTEAWRPVVGYEGFYSVSDHGRVRSEDRVTRFTGRWGTTTRRFTGQLLSTSLDSEDYPRITLYRDNAARTRRVYKLVMETFIGPCPAGMEALHWDDDKQNTCLNNLRWGTRSENRLDAVRNGRHCNAAKTQCPQKHDYTPENTFIKPNGGRGCRECRRESVRRFRQLAKATA